MNVVVKSHNLVRKLVQLYGPRSLKTRLWNREFSSGHWDKIFATAGDFRYPYIEKYARVGSILDLGCGSGNTGVELKPDSYARYLGVDISDAAIRMAAHRSALAGRTKNCYLQGDIRDYAPPQSFDVILFRESLYYVAPSHVEPTLRRYARFLLPDGVIIVTGGKGWPILERLAADFESVEQGEDKTSTLLVLRPRRKEEIGELEVSA